MSGKATKARRDARRRSFFETPKKPGKHQTASSNRKRRVSTTRDHKIEVTDGFVYKKKRAKTGKAAAKFPSYPKYQAFEGISFLENTAAEVTIQRTLEGIVEHELARVSDVYSDGHEEVASAVADVASKFLQTVKEGSLLNSVKILSSVPSHGYKNPVNQKLVADVEQWTKALDRVQRELADWATVKAKYDAKSKFTGAPYAASKVNISDPSTYPAFLDQTDKKHLSTSCMVSLSSMVPEAFKDASLQSEYVLSELRKLHHKTKQAEETNKAIAKTVNASKGSNADTKNLIADLLATSK